MIVKTVEYRCDRCDCVVAKSEGEMTHAWRETIKSVRGGRGPRCARDVVADLMLAVTFRTMLLYTPCASKLVEYWAAGA